MSEKRPLVKQIELVGLKVLASTAYLVTLGQGLYAGVEFFRAGSDSLAEPAGLCSVATAIIALLAQQRIWNIEGEAETSESDTSIKIVESVEGSPPSTSDSSVSNMFSGIGRGTDPKSTEGSRDRFGG